MRPEAGSPFPGMDPYLERAPRWESIHNQLISALPDLLEPVLPERYAVSVEERVYLTLSAESGGLRRPDAFIVDQNLEPIPSPVARAGIAGGVAVLLPEEEPIRELFLTIRDLEAGEEVVTVFEILSPTNKLPGRAREEYLQKRGAILASRASLLELDFLRAGPRMPLSEAPAAYQYSILVSRAIERPEALLLPFSVREPIPQFPVPLRAGDSEPVIDIGPSLRRIYSSNRLRNRVNYSRPPEPPLAPEDQAWADQRIIAAGLR